MPNDLFNCNPEFDSNPFIEEPYVGPLPNLNPSLVALFDQNGYDLTRLEQLYYKNATIHRNSNHISLRKPWFLQYPFNIDEVHECLKEHRDPFSPYENLMKKNVGAILNHCFILERKGFTGRAYQQIEKWAQEQPIYYKVLQIKPKWGIDFSIDYVSKDGSFVFELLHYEWDSFRFEDVVQMKSILENIIQNTDWDSKAEELIQCKNEWDSLGFFDQSDWKCAFFGLPPERFKIPIWNE